MQNRFQRKIKFFLLGLENLNRVQVLDHLSVGVENIRDYDGKHHNLVIEMDGELFVYKFPSCEVIYRGRMFSPYYSRNNIVTIIPQNGTTCVSIKECTSNTIHHFFLDDYSRLDIVDCFPDFFVFTHQGRLKTMIFETERVITVAEVPKRYYIGKENSVAIFTENIIIVSKSMPSVSTTVVEVCADLVGIIIIFNELHQVVFINDQGILLQVITPDVQVLSICGNNSTQQLFVSTSSHLYLYD